MAFLKKTLPWLAAVGIFAYLFHLYPPSQIGAALKSVRAEIFFPLATAYFLYMYFVDAWTTVKIFNHFGRHTTLKNILPARGVTYLMQVVNYAAGQASFSYYLKKKNGIPLSNSLGIFSFIALVDLYWLLTFALIGSFYQRFSIGAVDLTKIVILFVAAAYASLIVMHQFWQGPLSQRFKQSKNRVLKWIYAHDFFHTFNKSSVTDYFKIAAWRFLIALPLNTFLFFAILTFDASVPFWAVFAATPLVIIVGVLPITPGGIGTTNAVMVALLSPLVVGKLLESGTFTAEGLIFTASLIWMGTNYFLKALLGAICLKFTSKDLFREDA